MADVPSQLLASGCAGDARERLLAPHRLDAKPSLALSKHCLEPLRPPSFGGNMGRREFLSVLGATAAAWPLAARGQQPMPVIGFLSAISEAATLKHQVQFRRGLSETGFVPGQNVVVEYRWAEGQYDRLPGMAADLVRRKVDVIAAQAPPAALAARTATTTGRASPTPTGRPASTSAASLWVRTR